MLDDVTTGTSAPLPRCMWCSAELPSASEATCPSCGATLIGEDDEPVPGVTAIDAEAIVRGAREARTKPRSRLMSWISGEYAEGEEPAPPGSLSPPPPEVRREMLRLELEAQVANLQAEATSMAAEQAVESGLPLDANGTPIAGAAEAVAATDAAPPATLDAAAPAPDAAAPAAEDEPTV